MKANNIQNSQIADDPPLPTFWGEIRNFFTGLPDRWSQDTGLAHIDRPAECHKNITEEEGLPTLSGLIGSFCASHLALHRLDPNANVQGRHEVGLTRCIV